MPLTVEQQKWVVKMNQAILFLMEYKKHRQNNHKDKCVDFIVKQLVEDINTIAEQR